MPYYDSTRAFFNQQITNFVDMSDASKILRTAAVTMAPEVKKRVQQYGQKSDGSQIGKYSDKYYKKAKTKAKSFGTQAQRSSIGKGPIGYKELRRKMGRQVQYIDFTFSGQMFDTWLPVFLGPTSYGITFTNRKELKISRSLEDRFGNVFDLSNKELTESMAAIEKDVLKYLSR